MQRKTILVADDDVSIVDAISIMLGEIGGHEVVTEHNGDNVQNVAEQAMPDLILLDLWMSGVDGKDVCRKLKSSEKTAQIPVVIFSANRDIRTIAEEAGANDYLAKPFDMSDMLSKVEKLTS